MTSQLNNSKENNDQVLQETDTLRPVFFDSSAKRNPSAAAAEKAKRARLDASVAGPTDPVPDAALAADEVPASEDVAMSTSRSTSRSASQAALLDLNHRHHPHIIFQHHILDPPPTAAATSASDASVAAIHTTSPSSSQFLPSQSDASSYEPTYPRKNSIHRTSHSSKKSVRLANPPPTAASTALKAPKLIRRFRSRSLPIINYTSRSHMSHQPTHTARSKNLYQPGVSANASAKHRALAVSGKHCHITQLSQPVAAPSLPPINLQSLKEIDLQEILKNPQLRHDILFDPQLQFRPNLDGDRGRRKKSIIEKYWVEIESECAQFFDPQVISGVQEAKISRLPALFTTMRDILLSLLPLKDRAPVNEIMDIELVVSQFTHGSFDFVAMAQWLGEVFKSHCAPMRDVWVSEMITKFQDAYSENSVGKLVQGLRSIFAILEAMKLDVANHQIRILRPVLIETAVDFEKDYFNQLINHCKIDISDSLKWFYKNYNKKIEATGPTDKCTASDLKSVVTSAIIDLLSCRNMATEFPSTLAFDHTRLVLLRADVRQLVCVQLCIVLFKQLVMNYEPASVYRQASLKPENINKVQEEILAIVTDDNGNIKWTRNISAIALQLVKNVITNPISKVQSDVNLPQALIEFSRNWLIKQIQPSSNVYGLMEAKVFKELSTEISNTATEAGAGKTLNESKLGGSAAYSLKQKRADSEMSGIATRIATLVKFHWCVFGDYYSEYLETYKDT